MSFFSSFKIIDNVLAKRKKKRTVTRISLRFIHGHNVFYSCVSSFPFSPSLTLVRSFSLSLTFFISFVGKRMDYASPDPRLIACTNVSKNKRRNCTINGCPVFCFFFFRFSKFLLKGMWRQWVIVTEPEINFISILSYWCLLYALKRSPKDGRNRPIGNLGSHGLHNFPSLSPFTFFFLPCVFLADCLLLLRARLP